MLKKIDLGKVDANGTGRKINRVVLEIELQDKEKGKVLSICGEIWNSKGSDMVSGGQNIEEIASLFKHNKKVQRICEIWKRWHLNDLHAGCEHQRALGWDKDGYDKHHSEACPVCGYKFGTEWKYEELPADIIKEIESL